MLFFILISILFAFLLFAFCLLPFAFCPCPSTPRKNLYMSSNCPHLTVTPIGDCLQAVDTSVSNRVQTISYWCRGKSEHEDIYKFFRPLIHKSNDVFSLHYFLNIINSISQISNSPYNVIIRNTVTV